MPPSPSNRKRSTIYIDGFNLYYGVIKGGPYKWLNLQRYFERLRPDDDIQVIRYFTAMISGPELADQETYLKALETLPLMRIILGKFKTRNVLCRLPACTFAGDKLFQAPEEKRTDVNIAISMLDDAYQGLAERMIVVSGDSDLVPALNIVRARFPKIELIVYVPALNPTRGAAVELRAAADRNRILPLALLPLSQFPVAIPDGSGGVIKKPPGW
ncbi:MAG: NYN domain-containing protein [Pirellulales bacterium]